MKESIGIAIGRHSVPTPKTAEERKQAVKKLKKKMKLKSEAKNA